MKKIMFILFCLSVIIGFGFAAVTGLIPALRTDNHILNEKSLRFFECIKFKEFEEAANYHNKLDRKESDIPQMLEDIFHVPPENLDINNVYVVSSEIDSSGVLGKVKLQMSVKMLNSGKQKNPEINLFWKKENGSWFLKLKSSLKKNNVKL